MAAVLGVLSLASADMWRLSAQTEDGRGSHVQAPATFVSDVDISERFLSDVEDSLQAHLLDGVRRFDWAKVAGSLTERFDAVFPGPDQGQPVADALFVIRRYGASDGLRLTRDAFVAVLREHTRGWTSVDRASWHTFEFLLEPGHAAAFLKAHVQLGGADSEGARTFIDLTVDASVVRTSTSCSGGVDQLAVVDGTYVHSAVPPFRDISDAVGFHFNRSDANQDLRQDIVDTRSSLIDSSLSIVDWDHDGFWDIIATESMNQAVLFLNDGKGGFSRGTFALR